MIHSLIPSPLQAALLAGVVVWISGATWLISSRRPSVQFLGYAMLAMLALVIVAGVSLRVALWLKGGVQ